MKRTGFILGFLLILLMFAGCKKDETKDDNNNDNSGYVKYTDLYTQDGSITVNIKGTSYDGISLDETFKAIYYNSSIWPQESSYHIDKNNNEISVYMSRSQNYLHNNNINFHFCMNGTIIDTNTSSCSLYFEKQLSNNQVLNFSATDFFNDSYKTIINIVSFDQLTGKISGNYNFNYEFNDYLNNPQTTIISGTFDLTLKQSVYK